MAAENKPDHETQAAWSAETQEILNRMPGPLLRSGSTIILGLLLLLLGGSWFIAYPERLEGSATISTDPEPIMLEAQQAGRLGRLLCADGCQVTAGMPIAELENPIGLRQISRLRQQTDSLEHYLLQDNRDRLRTLSEQPLAALGPAQPAYDRMQLQLKELLLLQDHALRLRKTENIRQQLHSQYALSAIAATEQSLAEAALRQAEDRYRISAQLFQEKVISRQEHQDEAIRLREKILQLEQQKSSRIRHSLDLTETSLRLLQSRHELAGLEMKPGQGIRDELRNIRNYITEWERQFLIKAPFNGNVKWLYPLQPYQTVHTGQALFAVIPDSYRYMATVLVPAAGAGKIQTGQRVQLFLAHFPQEEFGCLEGTVCQLGQLPQPPKEQTATSTIQYRVSVSVKDMTSSYGQPIPFSPGMPAQARILTSKRNLLQRLLTGATGRLPGN